MPNIATVLKAEIARVARKEVKAETASLRKSVTTYRSEIAALKRRSQSLEQEIRRLGSGKGGKSVSQSPSVEEGEGKAVRFSSKGLASQRKRLGLSAQDLGVLIGTTSQSIYNWEEGKARPRAKYMPAIAALKSLGKKTASAHLESARSEVPPTP